MSDARQQGRDQREQSDRSDLGSASQPRPRSADASQRPRRRQRNAFQTPNALRIARCRLRRKAGQICLRIVLDPWQVSGLVSGNWLDRSRRSDANAVRDAFARFAAVALDQRRYPRPGR
jgi:hypothetical protein